MGAYDFLSEGDNVVFNPLLTTGLQDPSNPTLGGWGGRAQQNSTSPDLWALVDKEKAAMDPRWRTGRQVVGLLLRRTTSQRARNGLLRLSTAMAITRRR